MQEITALIDREHKIIMDWTPKCGCTIAVKMFFRNMDLLDEALAYDQWIHEYRMHVFQVNHPTLEEDLHNPEFYKFKIVRNPYTRVVSSYIHTMRKEVMHPPVKKVLKRWNANISFEKFITYLEKIDLKHCDPHYALQKKFFEFNNPNCFDQIIKLEEMNDGIEKINAQRNLNLDLTGISSHHHTPKNKSIQENYSRKRWSKVAKNVPDFRNFYTDELIERVTDLYREDIDSYGYSFEEVP